MQGLLPVKCWGPTLAAVLTVVCFTNSWATSHNCTGVRNRIGYNPHIGGISFPSGFM